MKREDFKNISREHIEACKVLVSKLGRCKNDFMSCISCPFSKENSTNEKDCKENGYKNEHDLFKFDYTLVENAEIFIEKFSKSFGEVSNKIDLNLLKKYEFQESLKGQYNKIMEEVNEFYVECVKMDKEKQIAVGLDVITAMLNYLTKVGMTEKDFEKHIEKLKKYKKEKYKAVE